MFTKERYVSRRTFYVSAVAGRKEGGEESRKYCVGGRRRWDKDGGMDFDGHFRTLP